jgi:four helix bundle protein
MIIACREARETQYWLRLIDASGILPPGRLMGAIDEVTQLVAILATIVKVSRGSSQ